METLAWKSNWKHAVLEYQIKEIDTEQDLSRSAITNRAIAKAKEVKDWKKIKDNLVLIKKLDIPVAVSMQAKTDEVAAEELKKIRKKILIDLDGELERLQTPYMIQLLWLNYYENLKKKALIVGSEKQMTSDLTGPDMVKRLVQILLLNREADAAIIQSIKTELMRWEE